MPSSRNRSPFIPNWDEFPEQPLGDLDRAAFSCGDEEVDGYFTGAKIVRDITNFNAAAFVIRSPENEIVSFYTLSNTSVPIDKFSKTQQKRYDYDNIAAILISYLGVDTRFKRRGFGARTLKLALERCLRVSRESGVSLIVVDVETKNDVGIKLYRDAEFKDLITYDSPGGRFKLLRMYLSMKRFAAAQNPQVLV